jgi:hypothetical protein
MTSPPEPMCAEVQQYLQRNGPRVSQVKITVSGNFLVGYQPSLGVTDQLAGLLLSQHDFGLPRITQVTEIGPGLLRAIRQDRTGATAKRHFFFLRQRRETRAEER